MVAVGGGGVRFRGSLGHGDALVDGLWSLWRPPGPGRA